ncbi:alpha/beta-hydrolase [Sarocladium strictum]
MKAALTLALGASLVSAQRLAGSGCDDVHVFIAKGNNEPYPGRQGKLVSAICNGIENCDYEDIQFYNPLPAPYCQSVAEGARNGVSQITEYNRRCPDTKLVVSGYSQGGQVAGDILGGGGGVLFEDCQQPANAGIPASSAAGQKIVAALIFGDVRHTRGQSYNYLDGGNRDGVFPRPASQLANLAAYGDRLRNYCDATDPICAGGDVVANHLNYFDIYSNSAAAWVQSLIKAAPDTDNEDKPTTKPSSTLSTQTYAAAPTTLIPPKHANGTVITTTICPEVTQAIEGVASSTYEQPSLTFAPGPSGTYTPGKPSDVAPPADDAAPTPVPTAGASAMQRSALGVVAAVAAAYMML